MKQISKQSRLLSALLIAFSVLVSLAPASLPALAAPEAVTPVTSLSVPATTMIGEAFSFTVTFDNTGTGSEVGYGPYVDLFLPIGGADGTSASGANDGISFGSATYLGASVNAVTLTCAPGGTITHPLTGLSVTCPPLPVGFDSSFTWQFVNLELPFGSFAADQPPAAITVNANLSNLADLGIALPIQARGGFRYGSDPLDNPATDPPIIQASPANAVIAPTLILLTKTYHGPEDETATGPNFPREYTIAVDIANGQTITNLDLTDYLPGNLQFVQVVSTSPAATCGTQPSTTTPGGNLVCTFASVTGSTGTSDATVRFRFYAPLNDAGGNPVLNASTGDDASCINHAGALGDWTPIDPRDAGGTDNASAGGSGNPPEHILGCKSIAIQKSVANLTDSTNSPGDVLEYTLNFQVSDFFAFQNVIIDDLISDGQHFQAGFAPTLQVIGNGFSLAAANMAAGNVNVVCNYTGGPGGECDSNNPAANDGKTAIAFDISAELVTRGRPDGKLLGGCVPAAGGDYDCDPFNDGATTATVKFRTVILDAYTDIYPSGDPSVDQGDRLDNDVTITGAVLNNADLTPTGNSEADTSAAGLNIAQGSLQKTIYAKNGVACATQPCANVQGTPGDTITYRLRYTHPTSDFEQFSIEDFLPLPVFSATEVASFSNTVCGVPAAGVTCLGPADTYHNLLVPAAVTPARTTNAANNAVKFTYGNYDNAANTPSVVDLLFTVTIEADPFADGLYLTNQVRSTEGTTQSVVRTVDAIVQFQIFEPVLNIRKGAIATDKAGATFNPTGRVPANVTVSAPGSACSRLSGAGTPITSSNLGTTFASDVSGVDAGDLVTFAIVVENTGRGPNGAFDVRIKDDLPAGFVAPAGGINLCATDGTGAAFSVTNVGGGTGLLDQGIELVDPGPTNPAAGALDRGKLADGTVVTNGFNIAIVIFDLQVASTAQPGAAIDNTATLFNFAGQEGGTDFTTVDKTDTARTTIAVPILSKILVSSSEAYTVQPLTLADFTGTGFNGYTPGTDFTGNTNTWATAGNTTPNAQFLRIGVTATERGGGFFTYTAPNYLDLRGYNTIGLLVRPLADNAATPLWIQLTDADGTIFQLIMPASPTAGLPGFAQLVSSGTLLAPSSIVAAGATAGLDLAQIAKLELRGDNGTAAMRMDIDRIVALRTLAAPGEIVRYRLTAQIPEGTLPDFALSDALPGGMRFINDSTVRVAFVANGGGITSSTAGTGGATVPALTGAGLNLTGSGDDVSSFSLAVGGANGLAIGEGSSFDANVSSSRTADTDTYSDDTDVWFRLGTLTNADNDADAEYVVIEFNALVTNDRNATVSDGSAQQAGASLSNTFQTRINSSTGNTQVGSTSTANDFQAVIIVEPQINNLGKTIVTAPVDAGDPIAYQIKFSNNTAHPAQYAPQVRAATTAAFSATFNASGGTGGTGRYTGAPASVDGITLAEGDRVLVKNQAAASQNGIYKVVDAINGIWDRATDFDTAAEMNLGYRAHVTAGAANGGKTFALDAAVATINSSPATFSEVAANPTVQAASTANLGSLTSTSRTIDGVTLNDGERVLLKNQSTASQNGIYRVTVIDASTMSLARATDFDAAGEVVIGYQTYVNGGTVSGGRTFAMSAGSLGASQTWTPVDPVTAFDLVLTDPLPADVLFQSVTIVTPDVPAGQTFTASGSFTGGSVTVPAVGTNGTITVNLDKLAPESKISGTPKDVTITVNGTVSASAVARQEIVNIARLTYTGLPGPKGTASNPTGTDPTTSGSVEDSGGQYGERNGSGVTATDNTPVNYATGQRNNYSVAATVIVTLNRPTVDKSFKDGTLTEDDTSLPDTTGANVTIGEQVTYDILVTLPEGAIPDVVVNDVVPAGMRLESYSVITLASGSGRLSQDFNGTLTSNPPTVAPALPVSGANTASFTFSNCTVTADGNAGNNAFVLRVTATVLNIIENQAGVTRTNTATLRFDDPAIADRIVSDSNAANDPVVTVVEPSLTLNKAVQIAPNPADAAGTVAYRITFANATGATVSTAFDSQLVDTLPAGLSLINPAGIAPTFSNCGSPDPAVTNTSTTGAVQLVISPLIPGCSVTVDYSATILDTALAGDTVDNTANLTYSSLPGSVAGERDGSGGVNDYATSDPASFDLAAPAIDKLAPTPASYAIGEVVTYNILVTLPEGTTQNVVVFDDLPLGLQYVANSLQVLTTDGLLAATFNGTLPAFTLTAPGGSGGDVTVTFSGDSTTAGDNVTNNNTFLVRLQALVLNVMGNQNSTVLTNNASVRYTDPESGVTTVADPTPPTITLVEPRIVTTKAVTPISAVEAGTVLNYTVTFANTGSSPAYDVTAQDTLAQGVTFTALGDCKLDGADVPSTATLAGSVATFDGNPPGSWDIPVGKALECRYTATAQSSLYVNGGHTNTVDADWSSLNGAVTGERIYDDTPGYTVDGTQDTATATFTVAEPTFAKTDGGTTQAAIGSVIQYVLTITSPKGTIRGLTVQDVLPKGLIYNGDAAVSGISTAPTFNVSAPNDGSATVTLTWNFGNAVVTASPAQITFSATVANVGSNQTGLVLNNTATLDHSNAAGAAQPTLTAADAVTVVAPSPVRTGSIGNYVWLDEDGDGDQDASEAGIPNVLVTLTGVDFENNIVNLTTYTDVNGGYIFTGLPPSNAAGYTVTVTPPSGLIPTHDENGLATPNATIVVLVSGREHLTADFGYNWSSPCETNTPGAPGCPTPTGAIGDRLWIDADGQGDQDPNEIGLAGVTVNLYTDPNGDGVYDFLAGTRNTDNNGNYIFDDLVAGAYAVKVDTTTLPGGYSQTGDPDGTPDNQTTSPVLLAPGDVYVNADFGYQPTSGTTGTIGDTIWLDANRNNSQDSGEPGIPGVTVSLIRDINANGQWDAGEPIIATDITDENGKYGFSGLPVDDDTTPDYLVWVNDTNNVLNELDPIYDSDGATPIGGIVSGLGISAVNLTPSSSINQDQDFAYAPPGHEAGDGIIGDTIFLDRDGSGTFNPGEGLERVVVELLDGNGIVIARTVTNENGQYFFGGLAAGAYTVRVDTSTLPGAGTGLTNVVDPDDGTANRSEVTIGGAQPLIKLDQDFGYQPSESQPVNTISGTLWEDTNADGALPVSGEAGRFENVTVALYADTNGNGALDSGDQLVGATTTGSNGNYSFTRLPDGAYFVDVTDDNNVLNGYWKSDGPNAGQNSNSQVDPYKVSVSGGQTNDTGDFGYYILPGAVGNRVWLDDQQPGTFATDKNGIQDPNEPGIGNVKVTLTIVYPNTTVVTVVAVTDDSNTSNKGYYSFGNLLLDEDFNGIGAPQPTHVISVLPNQPAIFGFFVTPINAPGSTVLNDSDDPAGTLATPLQGQTDTSFANDTAVISSFDFGYTVTPFAVNLAYFHARAQGNNVLLTWASLNEIDLLGFNLYRAETQDGPWTQLNATMIAALNPGSPQGNAYDWTDTGLANGSYWYRLEWIGVNSVQVAATTRVQVGSAMRKMWMPMVVK